MTARQRQGLSLALPGVWADEVLRERGGSLTADELYRLTWLATGNRDAAVRARARRVLDEMREKWRGSSG